MPILVFLVIEQRLAARSRDWQQRLEAELPVIAEQIGMLLAAGWSVGGALGRIAERGSGCCASDLARVTRRVRHGLTEAGALAEWAEVTRLGSIDRLVAILALSRDTADIGRLITEEARSIRKASHRSLLEVLDRRSQTVWIPVTVAALLPGALFLAVPFLEVMRVFGAT
jgi:Flp pilus assembly protein TadB